MNNSYNELFDNNIGLVYNIANKMNYGYIDKDDLIQAGLSGLYEASLKYDNKINNNFACFASIFIISAIKKEMRENKLIVLSKEIIKIKKEIKKYENKTIKEIAEELKVSEDNVLLALNYNKSIESLNKEDEGKELIDLVPDTSNHNDLLKYAVKKLESNLQEIIILKYYKAYSQKHIAKILKCSQAKVSRLESIALKTIKKMIS